MAEACSITSQDQKESKCDKPNSKTDVMRYDPPIRAQNKTNETQQES